MARHNFIDSPAKMQDFQAVVTGEKSKKRYRKWPGLSKAAAALGVSYNHLRFCLMGKRVSARLMARYRDFTNQSLSSNSISSPVVSDLPGVEKLTKNTKPKE